MIKGEFNVGFSSNINSLVAKSVSPTISSDKKTFTDILESRKEIFSRESFKDKFKVRESDSKNTQNFAKNYEVKELKANDTVAAENEVPDNEIVIDETEKTNEVVQEKKVEEVVTEEDEDKLEKEEISDKDVLMAIKEVLSNDEIDLEEKNSIINQILSGLNEDDKSKLVNLLKELTLMSETKGLNIEEQNFDSFEKFAESLNGKVTLEEQEKFKSIFDEIKNLLTESKENGNSFEGELKDNLIKSQLNLKSEIEKISDSKFRTENQTNVESSEGEENKILKTEKTGSLENESKNKDDKKQDKNEISTMDESVPSDLKASSESISGTKSSEVSNSIKNDEVKIINSEIKNEEVLKSSKTPFDQKIMDQVIKGTKMDFNVGKDVSEMIIKLNPKELGNVALKISIHNETLVAEFSVESKIVKETIEANLADLKNALQEKGFSIQGMDVSVNQDSKESFRQFEEMFKAKNGSKKYSNDGYIDGIEDDSRVSRTLSLENTSSFIDGFA